MAEQAKETLKRLRSQLKDAIVPGLDNLQDEFESDEAVVLIEELDGVVQLLADIQQRLSSLIPRPLPISPLPSSSEDSSSSSVAEAVTESAVSDGESGAVQSVEEDGPETKENTEEKNNEVEEERPVVPRGEKEASGSWSREAKTAGGCMNYSTWRENPQFWLRLPEKLDGNEEETEIAIDLTIHQTGKDLQGIGFYLLNTTSDPIAAGYLVAPNPPETTEYSARTLLESTNVLGKSAFKKAPSVESTVKVSKGTKGLWVVPCTFFPGGEADFRLELSEASYNAGCSISVIETLSWKQVALSSSWTGKSAAGCRNFETWIFNPQFVLSQLSPAEPLTHIKVLITRPLADPTADQPKFSALGVYSFKRPNEAKGRMVTATELLAKSTFSSEIEATFCFHLDSHSLQRVLLLPCTFHPNHESAFDIRVFSSSPCSLSELSDSTMTEVSVSSAWEAVPSSVTDEGEESEAKVEEKSLFIPSAGGSTNNSSWRNNRQFAVKVSQPSSIQKVSLRLLQSPTDNNPDQALPSIGFYIFKGGRRRLQLKPEDVIHKTSFSARSDISIDIPLQSWINQGFFSADPFAEDSSSSSSSSPSSSSSTLEFVVMPCTYYSNQEGKFKLSFFYDTTPVADPSSSPLIEISELKQWHTLSTSGEWTEKTAGGCFNHGESWRNNPQFRLSSTNSSLPTKVLAVLSINDSIDPSSSSSSSSSSKKPSIGFYALKAPEHGGKFCESISDPSTIVKKAAFRKSFESYCVFELAPLQSVNILPCTFHPSFTSPFRLTFYSSLSTIAVDRLSDNEELVHSAKGEWKGIWAGGCLNYGTWFFNPTFRLSVEKQVKVTIVLTQLLSETDKKNSANVHPVSFAIVKAKPDSNLPVIDSPEDFVFQHEFEPSIDLGAVVDLDSASGPFLIVPSTFYPKLQQAFQISIFCASPDDFQAIQFEALPLFALKDTSPDLVETIFDADSVSESSNDPEPETTPESDPEPVPVAIESEPKVDVEPQPEPKADPDPQPEPKVDVQPVVVPDEKPEEGAPSAPPPPPPPSSQSPPPLPQAQVAKPKPVPEKVKATPPPVSSGEDEEVLAQIKNVQSRLRSVKNLPKPAAPKDTNPFFKCFNIDKILARRMYIADSDEEENEDDFDDDW